MFGFLDIIIFFILILWIVRLSNRLAVLEKNFRNSPNTAVLPSAQIPPTALFTPPPKATAMAPAADSRGLVIPTASDSNILARLGVLALVLGFGFFFKYSIDQGWIGEWARIVIGLAVAMLMVVLGVMWKKQYGSRADILSGGGVAVGFFA